MTNIYDLWLNQVCETASTEKRYLQDIALFEKWAEANHNLKVKDIPSQWREAKYSDKQAEKDRFLDGLKDVVSDYFAYLKKYGYTHLSINRSMAVVMSFLHHFDIPFKSIRIKHPYVQYHNRDITKEEILTILNNSGVRNRAIYLVLYETGMRPWTAVNLRWKHIKEDFMAKRIPMKIKLTSDIMKCGVSDRFVFIGDNGFNALSTYLLKRHLPLKDDDLVFVTDKPAGLKIGTHALSQAFNVIVKNLKLAETRGKKPKELRLYTLRKAFSKFMAVNVDRTLVEFWLGHTSTATHYVSEDLEYHRKMYAKGYSDLRLETPQVPANIAERINSLEAELASRNKEIIELKTNGHQKATEMEAMSKRMANIEEALKAMVEIDLSKEEANPNEKASEDLNIQEFVTRHLKKRLPPSMSESKRVKKKLGEKGSDKA